MRLSTAASVIVAAAFAAAAASGQEQPTLLRDGAYEVKVRLEVPNVPSWTATTTATVCLPRAAGPPLPVLGPNNPFAGCPASNVERSGARLSFDIVCAARGAARAHASYRLVPDGFDGRIAMVMGGKNMTMSELQTGRRTGDCAPADGPRG
jgi:hypothetical protein